MVGVDLIKLKPDDLFTEHFGHNENQNSAAKPTAQ